MHNKLTAHTTHTRKQEQLPNISNKNNIMSTLFIFSFDLPQPLTSPTPPRGKEGRKEPQLFRIQAKSLPLGDLEGSKSRKPEF